MEAKALETAIKERKNRHYGEDAQPSIGRALQIWHQEEQVGIDDPIFPESVCLTVRNEVDESLLDLAILINEAEGFDPATKHNVLVLLQSERARRTQMYVGDLFPFLCHRSPTSRSEK
jgi:hypothetical protein